MLNDAPDPRQKLGARPPTPPALKSEVVWFPGALLLLTFQLLLLMRGLRPSIPSAAHAAFVSSVLMLAVSLSLMLLGIARASVIWRSLALVALIAGVAADIFVATSAATGSVPSGLMMALLIVTIWLIVWSITGSHSAS